MRTNTLSSLIFSISMASPALVVAVEPLTEEAMSSVSLESGSLEQLLSIDGNTASGEDYVATRQDTRDFTNTISQAKSNSDRLQHDNTKEEGRQTLASVESPDIKSFDSKEILKTDTSMGNAMIVLNPKFRVNETTMTKDGGLQLDGSAQIERVQLLNARDGHGTIRGDFFYSNINSSASTVISGR